jgi:flavorubredoxin
MEPMQPTIDEIGDGIYRIATLVPEVGPEGFTFNQFLVDADEPLIFHTGPRGMFPLVAEAVATVRPVESLRWITFGHVEADECGSMNMWLAAAPHSSVAHGALGCDVSLNDLCDRPPRALEEGEVIDLGGKRVRQISTPHVPHGWEAQVLWEETTGTLLCGDLFSQLGGGPALRTDDVVEPAMDAEAMFHPSTLAPHTAATLRALGDLRPTTLAIMHGSSFAGDGGAALHTLADRYEQLIAEAA